MKVEFLFFEDCPSHETALARLRKVLAETAPQDTIEIIRVENEEQAKMLSFPGSPTIRIDGQDIDPDGAQQPFALACRVYRTRDGRFTPLPPEELIREAVNRNLLKSNSEEN